MPFRIPIIENSFIGIYFGVPWTIACELAAGCLVPFDWKEI